MSAQDGGEALRTIAARIHELSAENQRLFRELLAAERRSRTLSRSVWRVQEDERRRLARELHDGIGQLLVALRNQLEAARRERAGPQAMEQAIAAALETAGQALHDTRELSRLLRPAVLDDLGLMPALSWLARTVRERFAVEVVTDLRGIDERLDREIETLAFRIVQEALTNVAKHSGASRAAVEVERASGRLRIAVADEGCGFDPARAREGDDESATVGLRGMRDRAELFGGSLRVDAAPGRGTRIEVIVPLDTSDREALP